MDVAGKSCGGKYEYLLFGMIQRQCAYVFIPRGTSIKRVLSILKFHFEFLTNCENDSFKRFDDRFPNMFLTDLDDTLYPMSSGLNSACRKNIEGTMTNDDTLLASIYFVMFMTTIVEITELG